MPPTDHASRPQPSRARAARSHSFQICCALLAIACGGGGTEPPQPEPLPPAPALESIAYERLGSGKLAFRRVSDGNYLYVIDASARAVTALNMYPLSADPALSRDGSRITYIAWSGFGQTNSSAYDVSTKGVAGADSQRVSALLGQESSPSWSSDGQSIYFFSTASPAGIYRQPIASSPLAPTRVLTSDAEPCFILPDSPVSASATGRLAFSCASTVQTVNTDGSERRTLISRTSPPGFAEAFYAPTWSPDAQWLAFLRVFQDPTSAASPVMLVVGVVRADGSDARTVTSVNSGPIVQTIGHNNLSLAWSPDGSRLAFNVMAGGLTSHIHVVNIDGTGLVQVTTRTGTHDHSLTWVP